MQQLLSRTRSILRHKIMKWIEWGGSAIVWLIVIALVVAAFQ